MPAYIEEKETNLEATLSDIVNEGGLVKTSTKVVSDIRKLETVFRGNPITSRNIYRVLNDKAKC